VRLSRACDHAFHLVDEALDDGVAVFFALDRGEVDGKLATQSERVSRLASRCPRRFEDGNRALAIESCFRHGRARATRDRAEGGNDLPSSIARHLSLLSKALRSPSSP
jgi:hypothetical protein